MKRHGTCGKKAKTKFECGKIFVVENGARGVHKRAVYCSDGTGAVHDALESKHAPNKGPVFKSCTRQYSAL